MNTNKYPAVLPKQVTNFYTVNVFTKIVNQTQWLPPAYVRVNKGLKNERMNYRKLFPKGCIFLASFFNVLWTVMSSQRLWKSN